MSRLGPRLILAATLVALCVIGSMASAQGRPTLLWLPSTAPDADVELSTVETVFGEVLEMATDARHLVGRPGLQSAVEDGLFTLPTCLQGTEACDSPRQAIAQTLGAALVIEVLTFGDGERMTVTVRDANLDVVRTVEINEDDLRGSVYAAVGELTDSTGILRVSSAPSGAEVLLDDAPVGTTPFAATLPIGSYELRLIADGYFDHVTSLELRANDAREIDVEMSRRYAEVMVRSGTPDAYVIVDDELDPRPVNTPMQLDPGTHTVEVRAPGYDSEAITLELVAGDERDMRVLLMLSRAEVTRRRREAILDAPIWMQLGLGLFGSSTGLSDASGQAFDADREVRCVAAATGGCDDDAGLTLWGFDGEIGYAWDVIDLGVLGLGWRRAGVADDGAAWLLRDSAELIAVDRGHEWVVRFVQPGARWLFDDIFEPYGRTGFAIALERYRAEELGARTGRVDLTRTSLLYELHLGLRVHFNELLYGFAQFDVAANVSHSDAARVGATIGMGMTLDDIFGLDERLDDRFGRRDRRPPPAPAPEL